MDKILSFLFNTPPLISVFLKLFFPICYSRKKLSFFFKKKKEAKKINDIKFFLELLYTYKTYKCYISFLLNSNTPFICLFFFFGFENT